MQRNVNDSSASERNLNASRAGIPTAPTVGNYTDPSAPAYVTLALVCDLHVYVSSMRRH